MTDKQIAGTIRNIEVWCEDCQEFKLFEALITNTSSKTNYNWWQCPACAIVIMRQMKEEEFNPCGECSSCKVGKTSRCKKHD